MARRTRKSSGGVPEWVVTYGDMMSLLLCFFILLAAFSELKRDHEYQRVITAVREAFGFSGGVGVMPTDDPPLRSMVEILETMAKQQFKETKVSRSTEQGISGRETKVTKVHEGLSFTLGGHLTFETGSAELKAEAKTELLKIARLLKGRNNKISIRGHAARKILPQNSPYKDLRDLAYYRAKAIGDFLVHEGGISEHLLSVESRADSEPLALNRYDEDAQTANRRAEIIMTEAMAGDFNPNFDYSDEGVARGAAGN